MEQAYTIDKVGWHTQTPGNPETVEQIHNRFRVIIHFLQDNNLTKEVIWPDEKPITDDTFLHTSHLTAAGMEIVKLCYHKWLQGIDQGQSPNQLRRWEKALGRLENKNS